MCNVIGHSECIKVGMDAARKSGRHVGRPFGSRKYTDEERKAVIAAKNRKWYIEKGRKYRQDHPDQMLAAKLKMKYGITLEEYRRMEQDQGGRCKICGKEPWGMSRGNRLFVDHDHVTGKVRGLLCSPCNRSLGLLGDNVEAILKVLRYLKDANGNGA